MDKNGEILYVGKAKDLKKRVGSYFVGQDNLLEKTKILVSQIEKIKYVIAESEIQALLLEANYIKRYAPKFNARFRDDKRYPLVKITIKDKYPKVLVARRMDDQDSLYFGPFPNSEALKLVFKTVRRIFPYQSVINHSKRLCLYNHLGLCPCPQVTNDKEYRKTIRHIVTFLKGNTKKVIKNLETERNALSKREEFEKASTLQKKIDAIEFVTSPVYQKFDYKTISLEEDLRKKELLSLKECLKKYNFQVKKLERIECFDISNIKGTNATGSMVVFTNGEKDPSQYRRFRIKSLSNFPSLPNDFAMMQQVMSRRLNHKEWQFPDLIIVDGGKGQVSTAIKALEENKKKNQQTYNLTMKQFNNETISIPIIGLAKREETIIIPNPKSEIRNPKQIQMTKIQNSKRFRHSDFENSNLFRASDFDIRNFIEVTLPKSSPALQLLMRIRDEAHRFAIQYHRKLRSKSFISL